MRRADWSDLSPAAKRQHNAVTDEKRELYNENA